ncbi:unnamed protein product [Penicillium manginii]
MRQAMVTSKVIIDHCAPNKTGILPTACPRRCVTQICHRCFDGNGHNHLFFKSRSRKLIDETRCRARSGYPVSMPCGRGGRWGFLVGEKNVGRKTRTRGQWASGNASQRRTGPSGSF